MSHYKHFVHLGLICLVVSWQIPIHQATAQSGASDAHSRQDTSPDTSPDTSKPAIKPVAVALADGGTIHGQAMASNGVPAAHTTVALGLKGKVIGRQRTDGEGRFTFSPLKPGVYVIATGQTALIVRCYNLHDAPQDAVRELLLSRDTMIARGQQPVCVLLDPLVIGVVIAAAIAIPIAVSNNDDDDAS